MITDTEKEFLIQSNLIEKVGKEGLADSIKAWEYIKKKDVITKRTILHVHRLIMRNLWPEVAGKLRTWNVKVGYTWPDGVYRERACPHYKTIKDKLPEIIEDLNIPLIGSFENLEAWTKGRHIYLQKIHIFADGNGRAGRILYNWQRLKLGLPIHVIKYEDRWKYFKWFE